MAEKVYPKHTSLVIKERKMISLDGVMNVEGFDEENVTVVINEGKICIEGQGLKIESLTKDNGEIIITGQITGVYYSAQRAARGLLSKIFG